jgi:hypothetical protein
MPTWPPRTGVDYDGVTRYSPFSSARSQFLASVFLYAAITAVLGRAVLAGLSTSIANDAGDPLLTAAILHWNATHIPLTDAWWQFPIFHPLRDTLAFSEHLLGLSPIAAPIDWLTGDPLVSYNLTLLLTFPLSGATMYLLVYRLTRSAPGAFIAGLAFGFAPFRISHLPHVQMLAVFWAPLALLGLHAFLDSGRTRWLGLYGAAWLLQSAANNYALVFLSLLIGLWVLWFVVARRRWRQLGLIALATIVAALPLVPVLVTYVTVHDRYGFIRGIDEIRAFSADVAAVLCAPPALTVWGWVRVACQPEGELFPGLGLIALSLAALAGLVGWWHGVKARPSSPALAVVRRLLFAVVGVYAMVIASVLIGGPWRVEWGWFRASAGSLYKPVLVLLLALAAALALSPGARAAARRSSTTGFYLVAALLTWLMALGPTIMLMGESVGLTGPFAWLLALPGGSSMRVPARFWLLTALCLSVAAGFAVAEMLARRSRAVLAAWLVLLGSVVTADGWATIRVEPAPAPVPDPAALAGQVVVELPLDRGGDIKAQWRAVVGGWRSVNGYSGFDPSHYIGVMGASRFAEDPVLTHFQRDHELHVIVRKGEAQSLALTERQPGVVKTAENEWALQYRLPRRPHVETPIGQPLPIVSAASACDGANVRLALDRDRVTRWICPPIGIPPQLELDLGQPVTVGAYAQVMGQYWWEAPLYLVVDTSLDARSWREAWNGSVTGQIIDGSLRDPRSMRIVVPLPPHDARYLRVRMERQDPGVHLTIPEAEVYGPASPR